MENLILGRLIKEATPELVGSRVERVSATPPMSLHFELLPTGRQGTSLLTVTLDPRFPALFTAATESDDASDGRVETCARDFLRFLSEIPANTLPEGFVRTVAGSLRGAKIARIQQLSRDRVVRIHFLGDTKTVETVLWIELFGRRPNAVVVRAQENTILACSREGVTSASGSLLRTGETYVPPPEKDKAAVDSFSAETIRSIIAETPRDELSSRLSHLIRGLSPQAVKILIEEIAPTRELPDAGTLLERLKDLLLKEDAPLRPAVRIASAAAAAADFDVVLLPFGTCRPGTEEGFVTREFDTALEAVRFGFLHLCRWYRTLAAARIRKNVSELLKRLDRLRQSLESDVTSAERADEHRRAGELILANVRAVKKGSSTLEVHDLHSGGKTLVSVDLDPSLSPSQNAEVYFRKARKAARKLDRVRRRLADVENAVDTLKEFGDAIPEQADASETAVLIRRLNRILERLRTRKTLDARQLAFSRVSASPVRTPKHRRGPAEQTGRSFNPRVFETSDGFTVLVGRNNRENDYITYRLAGPEDLWLHASGMPGSHVILKRKGKSTPSRKAVEEAAAVAAYFSKGRTSSAVPVIYTKRKYVHRPRGARPGVATFTREKFLMARPAKPAKPGPRGRAF